MGAELVIAVDISEAPEGQATGDALRMLLQTFAIMGRSINRFELREADVVLRPALVGFSGTDFSARLRAIEAGRESPGVPCGAARPHRGTHALNRERPKKIQPGRSRAEGTPKGISRGTEKTTFQRDPGRGAPGQFWDQARGEKFKLPPRPDQAARRAGLPAACVALTAVVVTAWKLASATSRLAWRPSARFSNALLAAATPT